MIEKKRPRKLNSTRDSRVRGADEMYDAVNINVSTDHDASEEGGAGGDGGVIKPSDGNGRLRGFEGIPSGTEVRVVSSLLDDQNDVIYYFVWSTNAAYHGIYAYDKGGFFVDQNNEDKVKLVYRTKLFKFDSANHIKADIVMLSKNQTFFDKDYDIDPVLYFTDGINEPRKIHVLDAYKRMRSPNGTDYNFDDSPINPSSIVDGLLNRYENFDTNDYIHACPKTPVQPPKAYFENDPLSRVSNFEGVSGLQFAYQYIYDTGEESAISSYSDIVVPYGYLQQGSRPSANLTLDNICVIRIPLYKEWQESGAATTTNNANNPKGSDYAVRYIPKNVRKIRILGREGNLGSFFVIDTVNNPLFAGSYANEYLEYKFRNDRIKRGFSKTEAQKPFDAVPLTAGTQAAASNRMMYGDYVTGYDNVDVSATATIKYRERGEDFKTVDIDVFSTLDFLEKSIDPGYVNDRRTSIVFSVEDFPEDGLPIDTQVDVILTVRPKRNWHIYNAQNSFHGSRHLANNSGATLDPTSATADSQVLPWKTGPNLADDGVDQVGNTPGSPGTLNSSRSRTGALSNLGLNSIWGKNKGVCIGDLNQGDGGTGTMPKWKTVDSQTAAVVGSTVTGVFGTSAANPFILRGRPLLFQLSFKVKRNGLYGDDYKAKIKDYIEASLGGPLDDEGNVVYSGPFYPDGESPFFETLYLSRDFEYTINEGLDGGDAGTAIEDAAEGENNKIDVVNDDDDRKHLIIAVGNYDLIKDLPQFELTNLAPCGYIIVNKARPKFSLRSRQNIGGGSNYGVLQINLDRIGRVSNPDDVEILTAIPYIPSDFWLSKGFYTNAGNRGEGNGVDDTKGWWTDVQLTELASTLGETKNWGLYDTSIWQFETKVIDSWWCFSKEYMVQNTLPSFLFTSVQTDYARYKNGSDINVTPDSSFSDTGILGNLANDALNFLGVDALALYDSPEEIGQLLSEAEYGQIFDEIVTNGGRLKNAAVVRSSRVKDMTKSSVRSELVGDVFEFITDTLGGGLHFRHNANASIGGDGILVPAVANTYDAFNGMLDFQNGTRARIVGWLDSGEGWLADKPNRIYAGNPLSANVDDWEVGFTTIDGAGGIGSAPGGDEAILRYDVEKSCAMGSVNGMMVFHGYIGPRATVLPSAIKDGEKPNLGETLAATNIYNTYTNRYDSYFNNFGQDCMMPFLGQFNYIKLNQLDGVGLNSQTKNLGYRWVSSQISSIVADSPTNWPGSNVDALYYATPLDIPLDEGGQTRLSAEDAQNSNHDWRQDYNLTKSREEMLIEILDVGGGTLLGDSLKSGWRSFKTRANHDFGIVFYDERGRAGRVNPITFVNNDAGTSSGTGEDTEIIPTQSSSLYIAGYSERGNKGAVSIDILLDEEATPPPSWASHYQIVYGGNSTKSNFVQYTTGGAFVAIGSEETAEEENTNIYVSLNYLQGNRDVSYAESFGALTPQGAKQMYTYTPGDKLRVISFFTEFDEDNPRSGREFVDYEFDIVGFEVLSSNPEDNPLSRSFKDNNDLSQMSDAKSGHFLVLKNNPFASGFSFNDVKNGENKETTSRHYWNNICLVEIYSPTKETADQESKLYYEISKVYDVGKKQDGSSYYKTNPLLIDKGDVWWRQVALAVPEFKNGKFENLIKYNVEEEESSQPRFQPYWIESKTFSDSFAGNDVLGRGKPNIIDDEFGQKRNMSGIAYSEPHIFNRSKNRFSSFNAVVGNEKILPGEYGKIEYMLNNYDSILLFQENKVSAAPVERSILSTADGSNSLVQSNEVIGLQSFYAGDYGTGGNPESVLVEGNQVFFASKQNSEIYRLTIGGSIEVISSLGIKNEFYNLFRNLNASAANGKAVWVSTGYDRINEEFLVSLNAITRISYLFDQTYSGQFMGETVADMGEDLTTTNPNEIPGCSFSNADNFDVLATGYDNDSCIYLGCTDNTAVNYDSTANYPCDNNAATSVPFNTEDGTVYQNVDSPFDCQCRYFNPCIFDTLSVNPNGVVSYSDVIDLDELIVANNGTQEVPGGFFLQGNSLFEEDVLRLIGLDLIWINNGPQEEVPPISLAPFTVGAFDGYKWPLDPDGWDDVTKYMAIARYTEGPPFIFDDPNTDNAITDPIDQQISAVWQNSGVVEWWDGFTENITANTPDGTNYPPQEIVPGGYWVAPTVLSNYRGECIDKANDLLPPNSDGEQLPNTATTPYQVDPPAPFWQTYAWAKYNPQGDSNCEYTACKDTDSPNVINYDVLATYDCRFESTGIGGQRLVEVNCGYWNPGSAPPDDNGVPPNVTLEEAEINIPDGQGGFVEQLVWRIVLDEGNCCPLYDNFQGGTFVPGGNWNWNDNALNLCANNSSGETIEVGYCTNPALWPNCSGLYTLSLGSQTPFPSLPSNFLEIWDEFTAVAFVMIPGNTQGDSQLPGGWFGPEVDFSTYKSQYAGNGGYPGIDEPLLTSDGHFVNVKTYDQVVTIINWMNSVYDDWDQAPQDVTYVPLPAESGEGAACLLLDCQDEETGGGIADIRSGGYVYWEDCCQYECMGQYAVKLNDTGDLVIDDSQDYSVFTNMFISPQNASETGRPVGRPECYNLVYSIEDYPPFTPNPNEEEE